MLESDQPIRILPVHIIDPRVPTDETIFIGEEFESLINTLGATVVDMQMQKLVRPHNATYIGSGKVEEIAKIVDEKDVDVVVLNAMLKPGQLHAIKQIFEQTSPNVEVWDRVELILRIFDKHAETKEAKLQIELARMNYMGPRIYGMGYVLSRQGAGIGTLGIGETNAELMRRHWRNEKKRITDQLKAVSHNHEEQIARRRESGYKTVSIVGYTNAGKSSLFNLLSKKETGVKDELFATLDSSVGNVYVSDLSQEVLVTDTIGFIRNLPPILIRAFNSTLLESIHADMLLQVIDASDPEMDVKINVVKEILIGLGIEDASVVYVFNKIDVALDLDREKIKEKYGAHSPIFTSVKNVEGIEQIIDAITNKFKN